MEAGCAIKDPTNKDQRAPRRLGTTRRLVICSQVSVAIAAVARVVAVAQWAFSSVVFHEQNVGKRPQSSFVVSRSHRYLYRSYSFAEKNLPAHSFSNLT